MMDGAWLNLAARRACTQAEGPGRRAALWVQGCDKRCPGCCNPRMLPFVQRELVPAADVVRRLAEARDAFGIEGVTFLGGEPMLQARGLAEVAQGARSLGLTVMVFTGYTVEELAALQPAGWRALVDSTDVLVDGPYLVQEPDTRRRWIGSRNQRVHYLSDRYDTSIELMPEEGRDIELRFKLNGALQFNGWPVCIIKSRKL